MFHDGWSYFWLVFPVGFFVYRAWDRWLSYQRSRHALDVMRAFAAQGKDPPPELFRQAREDAYGSEEAREAWRERRHRRRWRYGPYWEWRRFVWSAVLAAAFWTASQYSEIPGAEGPFRVVAILMTCVAVANLVFALLLSTRPRDP